MEAMEQAKGANGLQYQCIDHVACECRLMNPPKRQRTKAQHTK